MSPSRSAAPPVTVLYHKNCPDGAVAAWLARLALAPRKVAFLPVLADQPLANLAQLAGHEVWVLDLCPNLSDLDHLAEVAADVHVLDHHATRADVAAARPHLVTFDPTTSGAMLTWRHFHGEQPPPEIVSYAEDMDLWRQALPDWRPMQALLRSCGRPDAVAHLHADLERDRKGTLAHGLLLADARDRLIEAKAATSVPARLGEHAVRAVQLEADAPDINSDVGNRVAEQHGGMAVVWRLKNGTYRYSLRSRQADGPPVDALAVQQGGGGHVHAAGFTSTEQRLEFVAEPRYTRALQVATEAALRAGDLLRQEQSRPGGPRGSGGHAEVDDRAEAVIRAALTEAFPTWAYLGEETWARPGQDPDHHLWLVDPNDGTRAYLRGMRGSAVSIALLRDGEPVLGVVYAPTAPDHAGDLFTWAEGCGPLRHHGNPVHRQGFPTELTSGDVVLVSQDADRAPQDNAGLVAPARYLPTPSIAYRLALVAAGHGVAAVSLNGPGGWDLAAGHALLLAVRGQLLDDRGQPVRYHRDGHTHTTRVFGAGEAIARTLAARPWHRLGPSLPPALPYDLVALEPGNLVEDPGLLARAQGCLLGQAAGDSLGSLVEFRTAAQIARTHPEGPRDLVDGGAWDTLAGQPTDDTELAWMLARSLVQAQGYDRDSTARAYRFWYESKPFDLGATTRQALSAVRPGASDPADQAEAAASRDSQANGALMRVAPLGIFGHALPGPVLAGHARADARLTHPHPLCQDANALMALCIARAVASPQTPASLLDFALQQAEGMDPSLAEILHAAQHGPPADYQTHMGWVRIALHNAFFRMLHEPSAAEAIVQTVRQGGDSDTNGAIVGALVGALYGRDALPEPWRALVLTCRPQQATSFGAALPSVRRPRPRPFWPVDALALAERLVLAGKRSVA